MYRFRLAVGSGDMSVQRCCSFVRLTRIVGATAAAVGVILFTRPLHAQEDAQRDPSRAYVSREALREVLDRLEQSANSPAYSEALRGQTRLEAEVIRLRLAEGDFGVGDRILLTVESDSTLTDTFTVDPGSVLTLPLIGDVPLRGVLRAELRAHLLTYLGQFLIDPIVRARPLVRVAVLGAVDAPGFYTIPGEALLTEAIMVAGGPTTNANVEEMRVQRGDVRIWESTALQEAVVAGLTLDQLNIQPGDQIVIPEQGGGLSGAQGSLRTLALLVGLPLSIFGLTRAF